MGEDFECCQTLDNRQIELDSNDRLINLQHTMLMGNRATNELRFSHAGEDRIDGNLAVMGIERSNWRHDRLDRRPRVRRYGGRDQFDVGSRKLTRISIPGWPPRTAARTAGTTRSRTR